VTWDAGDVATLELTVAGTDGTTAVTLALYDPLGVPAAPAVTNVSGDLWRALAPVPTAGEWSAVWTVTGTGDGTEVYRFQVAPVTVGPAAGRTYATTADLAAWLDAAPPAGSARLLRRASAVVDDWTRAAVYDVDTDQLPTVATIRDAFRDAVCAQVESWQASGAGPSGPGAAGYSQITAGRITLVRGAGSTAAAAPVVSGRALAPEAASILAAEGLLSWAGWTC
jgi:hypothetical protein